MVEPPERFAAARESLRQVILGLLSRRLLTLMGLRLGLGLLALMMVLVLVLVLPQPPPLLRARVAPTHPTRSSHCD